MLKVLIIQTASLGDVILATATAHSVRTLYPDAHIHFLAKDACSDMLRNNPVIDKVLVWNKKSKKYKHLFQILRLVRHEKYDAVINFQRFFSSGLLTAFSKAKVKAGYKNNPLSFLFDRKLVHSLNGCHEVERNLDLARLCFPDLNKEMPVISVEEPDIAELSQLKSEKYMTIFPGSLWQTKQFPLSGWKDFVHALPGNIKIILMGSPSDKNISDEISNMRPASAYNFCGRLNILQSAWIMKNAEMNFTNDSAPTHLASAVNAPVATIFCSTVPSFGFTPLSDRSFVIETEVKLSCRPCGIHGHRECPEKHFNCGHTIKTEQLTEPIRNYVS
ncbi:MAG: glycosyltransferase family 9 protein [Proteiniphilum sp.]|nr:glycosyltransferase family 9 protein [Proteiniphilum sp.]